ncbi:hypothetical protein ElyMa_006764700 [Elysia marginata]|uniref:Uncharacterized protein n=1 Tax=Elysia marginata TaxID=1093978 RepID=A0AAV4J2G6_9GAST|nr:hypothetical protein ElyMa_006764700 [Elysia marginata]
MRISCEGRKQNSNRGFFLLPNIIAHRTGNSQGPAYLQMVEEGRGEITAAACLISKKSKILRSSPCECRRESPISEIYMIVLNTRSPQPADQAVIAQELPALPGSPQSHV